MLNLELTDFDADRQLLDLPGRTLLIFTSIGCASCRWARQKLPAMQLPLDRLGWIDAGDNGGLIQRYSVFHLPSLFLVENGHFFGAVQARLQEAELCLALTQALNREPEELP